MVTEYVLTTGLRTPDGFYSLENSLQRRINLNPYSDQLSLFDPYIPKKLRNKIGENGNFVEAEVYYGATDVKYTHKLYNTQQQLVQNLKLEKTVKLENRFTLVLGDMEFNGMPLNVDKWISLHEWAKVKLEEKETNLKEQFPEIENWNSSKQVTKLFKAIGINTETKDKVKSKKLGTNIIKDSIQELIIKDQAKDFPIIDLYLQYKGFQKIVSNYGIKFLKNISPITERIHSNFIQILVTGRTASSSPNLQNIISAKEDFPEGKWWRQAFEAPKGRTFVIADYNSQELRVLADRAKEHNMLEAFKNGEDLHSLTASKIYNVPVSKKVNSHLRPIGKKINFSVAYGAGEHKLSQELKISKREANTLLDNFYKGYPGLKSYFDKTFKDAISNKYIKVDIWGRKSFIGEYKMLEAFSLLYKVTGKAEYKKSASIILEQIKRNSQNYPIQGTAASISKLAGIILRRKLKSSNAKIVLLIHDEYVVECDEKEQTHVKFLVEESMRLAASTFCKSIPIPADACVTGVWDKD